MIVNVYVIVYCFLLVGGTKFICEALDPNYKYIPFNNKYNFMNFLVTMSFVTLFVILTEQKVKINILFLIPFTISHIYLARKAFQSYCKWK